MLGVSDIYKIGIGPSSSHTVGPMLAAKLFAEKLSSSGVIGRITEVKAELHGSLALTGKGHMSDEAITLGLAGYDPRTVDVDSVKPFVKEVRKNGALAIGKEPRVVKFSPDFIEYSEQSLPLHENALRLKAFSGEEEVCKKTYYSLGGGFVVEEEDFFKPAPPEPDIPYPFSSADVLITLCGKNALSISALVSANELSAKGEKELDRHLSSIWQVMKKAMDRGMRTEGLLPGKLGVPRRAAALYNQLSSSEELSRDPMRIIDYVNVYALAVSEENAAGGRVVTAPTNGACGVVPAVLRYYSDFIHPINISVLRRYFLSSAAVGMLYKMNASISGAEVGCQGEVGVAASMAAAGLAELMGGSPAQVCGAAEIAMEHSLGLTCDPVGGLVQVPCIERNAIAAVKAINSSRLALHRTSQPLVSLDTVIKTMFETGRDMNANYRETSRGGLAKTLRCE